MGVVRAMVEKEEEVALSLGEDDPGVVLDIPGCPARGAFLFRALQGSYSLFLPNP